MYSLFYTMSSSIYIWKWKWSRSVMWSHICVCVCVCVYSLWPHIYVCVCVYFIYYIHIFFKKDMSSRTEKLNFLLLAMGMKIYDSYLSREYVTKYNDYYTNRYLIANYSRYSLKGQIISWVRKVIASVVLWYELSIRYRVSKFCWILWSFQLNHFMGCLKR